ncbi:MAG: radical SAM family heme chaperone HemW [Clostridiales bacterium]|nr:radical SAM family heme chaperone HemW [Clostridiales bacterium]
MPGSLGLYLHIPFCRSKCDYCDFYSLAGQDARMDAYQNALAIHLLRAARATRGCRVDTVYLGGGTPSYFGEKRLRLLLRLIQRRFALTRNAEITLEANPDSADYRSLSRLRRAGFNRISLGMQSANDRHLSGLHRPHSFAQTVAAVTAARKAKFKSLSLDLIYGLPNQEMADWRETVEQAIALAPDHLSCYGLTVELGTPLAARLMDGAPLPDSDLQADMYLWAVTRLRQAGYRQYEVSSFAAEGHESRHNLKYWLGREYLGFGPGAHSDFRGRRYSYPRDLEAYISGVLGAGPPLDEARCISKRERAAEYLMLRLRTAQGVEAWEYRREFLLDFAPLEAKLILYESHGWSCRNGSRWRLTPTGFLVSNQLISDLLSCLEDAPPAL